MKDFTLTEFSVASVAILGAVSGCIVGILHILFQSRCSKITLCFGLLSCDRKVPDPDPDPDTDPEQGGASA